MEFQYAETKIKPRVTSVVVIDPAAHTGLIGGSLANDYRILQGLHPHKRLREIVKQMTVYEHPRYREKGDAHSGTGVFIVTRTGNLKWATLRGTTHEVLLNIYTLLEGDMDIPPIIMIERPHPDNTAVNQTAAYFAGALGFTYDTQVVILPSKDWGKNSKRLFNIHLSKLGVRYENPSPHEIDATLHYFAVFYPTELYSDVDEEPDYSGTRHSQTHLFDHHKLLDADFFVEAINYHNRLEQELREFAADFISHIKRGATGKELNAVFNQHCRKSHKVREFRLW